MSVIVEFLFQFVNQETKAAGIIKEKVNLAIRQAPWAEHTVGSVKPELEAH